MLQKHRVLYAYLSMVPAVLVLLVAGQKAMSAKETFMVPMSDGIKLATDVFVPNDGSKMPVVLMRTPYNKNGNDQWGNIALAMGFTLVVQDTRGRYSSEGIAIPFDGDGWWGPTDGVDTLNWLVSQKWCNGKIGMFGGSALSIAQLMMAGTGTDNIAFYHITVGCPGMYLDGFTHGGVLRKALIYDWVTENKFSEDTLKIWMKHPLYDDYWQARDLRFRFDKANAPAVHIGGWYDIFAQGTIDAFVGMQTKGGPRAKGKQKLVMGPWTHGVGAEPTGELTFPNGKEPPNKINDLGRWAQEYLKGQDAGIQKDRAVTYYVMGDTRDPKAPGNEWRYADQWPPVQAKYTPYYFAGGHKLSAVKPKVAAKLPYTYDPANPVPTIGGPQLTVPAGPRDQKTIEGRDDIVLFTSAPMKAPLELTGKVNVKLWATTDVPDTDFIARLCVLYPDGTSYNICEGALRARVRENPSKLSDLVPGKPYLYNIDLWSTSIVINKGLRLRVHVTSSSYPAFQVNKNDGSVFGLGDKPRIAHSTVLTGSQYPSCILLPVVK